MNPSERIRRIEMGPELGPESIADPAEVFVSGIAARSEFENLTADDVATSVIKAMEAGILSEDQAIQAAVSLGLIEENE